MVKDKFHEGTEVVKEVAEGVEKGVKGMADETSRLIAENMATTAPAPSNEDDEALLVVLEDEEGGNKKGKSIEAPETVNPPDGPKQE